MMMRGAFSAQDLGVFAPYVETCFAAMWEQGLKMADPAVVAKTLTAADLPAQRLLELTQDQSVKDRLIASTNTAVERGVFGSPTFFVGDEMFFGKDRLRDVEEEVARVAAA